MSSKKEHGAKETMRDENERAVLKIKRAAAFLDMSPWTLRRKVYSGEIVGVKLGGRLGIERAELDKYIARCRTKRGGE
jgi:excisionase family DNA binding protein